MIQMKKKIQKMSLSLALLGFSTAVLPVQAKIEGSLDPESVVAQWSNASTFPKVIDINFSDLIWPGQTWTGTTGKDCPEYADSAYVNTIVHVPVNGGTDITYPVLFHNCTFANKESYKGYAGATSAFCRQYYLGEAPTGNSDATYNNWTVPGHTNYIEDNIERDADGDPIYGEAGFVQFCRDPYMRDPVTKKKVSMHGWMEIDHIPYVERVQWAWSSTAWGRGIKCDVKIGDGDWKPLVWMGSNKHKDGYTVFSDQGYFMENVIDAHDVSIRWRVWDGDNSKTLVQVNEDGSSAFGVTIDSLSQQQTARVHKIQIFGSEITAEQAQYAKDHPVRDVGVLTDLNRGQHEKPDADAPDADAPVVAYTVAQDGTGDYTKVQEAINAVPNGSRGLIYIRPGVYEENIYSGTKSSNAKFISLIGEDKETTILTSGVDRGANNSENTYNDCAALNVFTQRFYAENLTISNTSGNVGQAEALYTSADAHLFNNCIISGYQDTYKANVASRGYFTHCTIVGATDFIYDSGLEWFDDCEIRCLQGGGYITAAADAGLKFTKVFYPELSVSPFYAGLFFRRCRVVAEDGVEDGTYYLGRPWKDNCGTMFLNCTLGKHINPKGWLEWDGHEQTCAYLEYKSVDEEGNLIDTSSRASFSHQATDAEVEAYMNPDFLFNLFSDVPFNYSFILKGAAAPTNFKADGDTFTWESDDMAAGYLIYKDGQFEAFVTSPTFTKDAASTAVYTVCSVSRHGVTSEKVTMKEKDQLTAFPTAEGFGKYATGGRGGKVVTVTTLDDSGEGSLRWAFAQYPDEPLTIVFAVSGEIQLKSALSIKRADWTLAGQTAPGEGIVLSHNKVNFGGSQNFIVRNMRFRSGATDTGGNVLTDQACGVENCSNFIFDHCNFGWSVEENMNTQDSHFLTVQYSIVHEGLYNAGHPKGVRGYGTQWGGSPATYHHNLLAHNNSRSPRFNGARGDDYVVFMEYINNVNYNFGSGGAYGGENTADIVKYNGKNSAHECNFINNYYKPGKASRSAGKNLFFTSSYARSGATSWAPSKWYVNGNVMSDDANATADNWKAVGVETYSLDDIRADERIVTETPYNKYSIDGGRGNYDPAKYMMYGFATAEEAFDDVVNHAGTVNRDKVEQRIAQEVADGTCLYGGSLGAGKGIIDTENDVEGFYAYTTDYAVPADTDGDGMPDAWETAHGLNPATADQNTLNRDGYTALEVYLNSLMGETMSADFSSGIAFPVVERPQVSFNRQTSMLTVSDNVIGSHLQVFTTDGRLLRSMVITHVQTHLSGLPSGLLLMQVSNGITCPRTIKVRY